LIAYSKKTTLNEWQCSFIPTFAFVSKLLYVRLRVSRLELRFVHLSRGHAAWGVPSRQWTVVSYKSTIWRRYTAKQFKKD